MHHASSPSTIPPAQRGRLIELLREYGPYRRDQLRLKLLAAAAGCRADAEHLRAGHAALLSRGLPTTPAGWEARAREFEVLAELVRTYRAA